MILFITLSISGQAWMFSTPGCGCEVGQPTWVLGELDDGGTGCLGAWMLDAKQIEEPNDLVVPGCVCDTSRYKRQRMKINVVFPNIFNKKILRKHL
jgi:hypothetical protein